MHQTREAHSVPPNPLAGLGASPEGNDRGEGSREERGMEGKVEGRKGGKCFQLLNLWALAVNPAGGFLPDFCYRLGLSAFHESPNIAGKFTHVGVVIRHKLSAFLFRCCFILFKSLVDIRPRGSPRLYMLFCFVFQKFVTL